jgi:hypothetical protein
MGGCIHRYRQGLLESMTAMHYQKPGSSPGSNDYHYYDRAHQALDWSDCVAWLLVLCGCVLYVRYEPLERGGCPRHGKCPRAWRVPSSMACHWLATSVLSTSSQAETGVLTRPPTPRYSCWPAGQAALLRLRLGGCCEFFFYSKAKAQILIASLHQASLYSRGDEDHTR